MQTFYVSGMHCDACKERIEGALREVSGLRHVHIDREHATLTVEADHELDPAGLTQIVQKVGDYTITDAAPREKKGKGVLGTYAPLLVVFVIIVAYAVGMAVWGSGAATILSFIRDAMTAFFVVFGVLEVITLSSFSKLFASYDPIAKRVPGYAVLYPFLLVAFGVLMFFHIGVAVIAALTIIIFGSQTYGIIPLIRRGERVQCACIGTAFALPLSWVTVAENIGMIGMAAVMLIQVFM